MSTGSDPFSSIDTRNLLKHVFSTKIVNGDDGYGVKVDMLNLDNIYVTGNVYGPNGPLSNDTPSFSSVSSQTFVNTSTPNTFVGRQTHPPVTAEYFKFLSLDISTLSNFSIIRLNLEGTIDSRQVPADPPSKQNFYLTTNDFGPQSGDVSRMNLLRWEVMSEKNDIKQMSLEGLVNMRSSINILHLYVSSTCNIGDLTLTVTGVI